MNNEAMKAAYYNITHLNRLKVETKGQIKFVCASGIFFSSKKRIQTAYAPHTFQLLLEATQQTDMVKRQLHAGTDQICHSTFYNTSGEKIFKTTKCIVKHSLT
jgi:hypothetical protein